MPLLRLSGLLSALLVLSLLGPLPAQARNPNHPPFREAKADFHDKELALTYGMGGPASLDFALLPPLSVGAAVDHVLQPRSWAYRAVLKVVDEEQSGIGIAFTGAATHIRELIVGQPDNAALWGWQAGMTTSLMLEMGLTLRLGIQAYDTSLDEPGGQAVLLSPEIAYRMGLIEWIVVPRWPLQEWGWDWMGARIRL
ncbi:MAG: hypothetical protein VKP62_07995 [Candidatus Sericytochromatia bacterium]|nr:hypothetical protein [Candidatus Sericytochromatia bacterium]